MDKRILIIIAIFWLASSSLFIYKKAYSTNNNIVFPSYAISKDLINAGDSVTYSDNTPGAAKWKWNFGDGETSSEKSGSHVYTSAGIHTVTLKVTGNFQPIVDSAKKVTVMAKPETVAAKVVESFIKGNESPETGKPVRYESMIHAASYEWSLKGENARVQTFDLATYTFPNPGRHVLVLKLHKPDTTTTKVINVIAATSKPVIAAPPVAPHPHNDHPHKKGSGLPEIAPLKDDEIK